MTFVEAIPVGDFTQDPWRYPRQLISPHLFFLQGGVLVEYLFVQFRPVAPYVICIVEKKSCVPRDVLQVSKE